MEQYKQEFIEFMVESNVLRFGDFITKSGRKTPFFINTGNYTTGEQLDKLGNFYAKAINEHFGKEVDVKISIEYVDQDGDGSENDVKLGMWFNDKLYDNEYIYLKNYTNLSYSMGTWMTLVIREDATLVIN